MRAVVLKAILAVTVDCKWCARPFERKKIGAHQKRFCCTTCRHETLAAARAYGLFLVETGALTPHFLREWYKRHQKDDCSSRATQKTPREGAGGGGYRPDLESDDGADMALSGSAGADT